MRGDHYAGTVHTLGFTSFSARWTNSTHVPWTWSAHLVLSRVQHAHIMVCMTPWERIMVVRFLKDTRLFFPGVQQAGIVGCTTHPGNGSWLWCLLNIRAMFFSGMQQAGIMVCYPLQEPGRGCHGLITLHTSVYYFVNIRGMFFPGMQQTGIMVCSPVREPGKGSHL